MSSSTPQPSIIRLQPRATEYAVALGQVVVLEIDENPTTGYRWDLEAEPRGSITVLSDSFAQSVAVPGAGGVRTWTLEVGKGPEIRLTATLRQSWDRAAPPQRSAAAILKVGG